MRTSPALKSALLSVVCLSVFSAAVSSQQPAPTDQSTAAAKKPDTPPAASGQTSAPKAESPIQQQGTTFRLNVNLVQVHVTVRDASGKAIGNLNKDDFQLYDQGKLQPISTFAIETRESRREKARVAATTEGGKPVESADAALPDRFIALLFDDAHISFQDATFIRTQVFKFLDSIAPTDRVGVFSTSGQMSLDFTKDKEAVRKTLMSLIPRPRFPVDHTTCPDIGYYEADQIVNYNNIAVLDVVEQTVMDICPPPGIVGSPNAAQELKQAVSFIVKNRAPLILSQGDTESQFVYRFMQEVLRHLGGMPGERVMMLASPGFLMTINQHQDMSLVIDMANRANVVINTLDVRGVYVPDLGGDIADNANPDPAVAGQITSYQLAAQHEQSFVLRDFAAGTGGVYFGNSNDLAGGLNQLAAAPEVSYILGFSPQSAKQDGTFHALKVSLTQKNKYTVQARHGYFVPRHLDDPAAQEHQEIVAAIFSRDEILDMPLQIQTQYFRGNTDQARLSVLSRIDLKGIPFRKAEGWTLDNLTVVTAIFDDNGNYVSGLQKVVELKLQAANYEKLLTTGLRLKTEFDLKPGRYLVRQVVRDSEGSQMAARNGSVDIP